MTEAILRSAFVWRTVHGMACIFIVMVLMIDEMWEEKIKDKMKNNAVQLLRGKILHFFKFSTHK
jgi:hypothetical protein